MGQLACCASPETTESAKQNISQMENILAMHSSSIKTKFADAEQNHIFEGYEKLTEDEKTNLMKDCYQVDPKMINQLYNTVVKEAKKKDGPLEVVEPELVKDMASLNKEALEKFEKSGLDTIKNGRAAVVLLAGGQGTRLGFNHPKGMYKIGLHSKKSIFQVLVERFLRAQMLAHDCQNVNDVQKCKLLIMTSQENHKETVSYFKKNKYFGASDKSIVFFQQAMLPQVNLSGKMIMASKDHLKMGPNGNGGFFHAVANNEDVKKIIKNTDYVQIVGVDNVINKILDPVLIGYTKENKLHASGKACVKRDASEKVGVFCKRKVGEKMVYDIAEYSEISKEDVEAKNADGSLKFGLGYILVLVVNSQVLLKLTEKEGINNMYHAAKKKVDNYSPAAGKITPARRENTYKFELFLHSFLQFLSAGKFGVLQVDRASEFAPVKNANGQNVQDSPDTARALVFAEAQQWLEKFGFTVKDSAVGAIEIDPLLSYRGENLKMIRRDRNQEFTLPCIIDKDGNVKEVMATNGADQNADIDKVDVDMKPPQQLIKGAKLCTEAQGEVTGQKGPWAQSEREKIAKELIEFAQQQIDAQMPEVKRDDEINLVVRQSLEGEVPMTHTERDVNQIPYDKFKKFMENWQQNTKEFEEKAKVTPVEGIDGCQVTFAELNMPWPLDNRCFITTNYYLPMEDHFVFIGSSRGNDALFEKYADKVGKLVKGTAVINYWRISPINDGKGTRVVNVLQSHIGGRILDPMKKKMGERQVDQVGGIVEKIQKAVGL